MAGKRLRITHKKTKRYVESCAKKREAFYKLVSALPKGRLYYIDECGIDSFIYREYAYAPKGTKATGSISGKKFKRANVIAAKCGNSIVALMIYDGTTDSILFEYWLSIISYRLFPKIRTVLWIMQPYTEKVGFKH